MAYSKNILSMLILAIFLCGCQYNMQQQIAQTPTPVPPTGTAVNTSSPDVEPGPIQNQINSNNSIIFDPCGDLITDIRQFPHMNGKLLLAEHNSYDFSALLRMNL